MNLRVFYLTRRGISDGYFLANAERGTTERRTRHNRTQDETRSNAGGRSLKSSKMEGRRIILGCSR